MKRIVLIDDDSTTNFLNKTIIERSNLVDEVITFEEGIDALDYFKNASSSEGVLILLDINMPVMNGWEFLDEYQQIGKSPNKIVMLTSSINPQDKQQAEDNANVVTFKSKPLSMPIIQELVATYLN